MQQINNDCSLCIATYNWPAALQECLLSVKNQSVLPCEVIIGDDGSTPETEKLIEEIRTNFPIPIIHLWHKDDGFRLSVVRNRSFAQAKGSYIIQSDGDVIFHKHFVRDHIKFAKKSTFIAGARCSLNKNITAEITAGKNKTSALKMLQESKKTYNGVRWIPAAYLNYLFQQGIKQTRYVLGANMAFWKADILKVNGYNEQFTGWGKEDNDIALRLHLEGVPIRFLKFAAITFHLYHAEVDKNNFAANELMYKNTIESKVTFSPKGIDQYL